MDSLNTAHVILFVFCRQTDNPASALVHGTRTQLALQDL